MANLDTSTVSEILHSPAPLAALTIVALIAWRILGFVKSALDGWTKSGDKSQELMARQFENHSNQQVDFIKTFTSESKELRRDLSDTKLTIVKEVSELSVKLASVGQVIDQKLAMIPKTDDAIRDYGARISKLESDMNKFFEVLKKRKEQDERDTKGPSR